MPTKRFENIDIERKMKIFDAARNEFQKNGYEGASLNTIIREAGISKGTLYYYFEDKTDLFITVLKHYMEEMLQELGGIAVGEFSDDFWNDLETYAIKSLHMIRQQPDLIPLFRGLTNLPHTNKDARELYDYGKSIFTNIFKHGQEQGAVRTDIPLELLVNIIFAVDQAIDFWLMERWDIIKQDEIEKIIQLYMELYRNIAGAKSEKGAAIK